MARSFHRFVLLLSMLLFAYLFFGGGHTPEAFSQGAERGLQPSYVERFLADQEAPTALEPQSATPCEDGMAGDYPCQNIDLLSHLPLSSMGGGSGNDIWGWADPQDGTEYALVGRTNGTAFVDVSDPENPVYIGNLPSHTGSSSWRDIKVYADHAFVVSDGNGNHGMQIFDLTQLRTATPGTTFSNTAHYSDIGSAHNLAINEATGYAYVVGASACSGGLHMVNIQNPTSPSFAGCFSADGYTHDVQCVIYDGPDSEHQGSEICLASNEDTLTIVDVTDKGNPVQLSRAPYANDGYTHQGWLTGDHSHFLLGDELDELSFGHNTRTRVWDVSDLDNPQLIHIYDGPTAAIDHNLYIHEGLVYESNYSAGLRILDPSDLTDLQEIAYFDVRPENNNPSFNGTWSNYPYFDSGIVIVNSIERGLFVLQPTLGGEPSLITEIAFNYGLSNGQTGSGTFALYSDLSFTDGNGANGDWLYLPGQQRILLRYDVGAFCDALFVGKRTAPGAVSGLVTCRDGSGINGLWGGTFGNGMELSDLAPFAAQE